MSSIFCVSNNNCLRIKNVMIIIVQLQYVIQKNTCFVIFLASYYMYN